jgi:hypothetical protein
MFNINMKLSCSVIYLSVLASAVLMEGLQMNTPTLPSAADKFSFAICSNHLIL